MKTYTGVLNHLPSNGIFVFGSNTEGRHGKGAALIAVKNFGAKYGIAKGMQGRSYAIVTKDLHQKVQPSINYIDILYQIYDLYEFAENHPELDFYIAYSGEGKNLNGYTPEQMADMFNFEDIPKNIVFEEKFYEILKNF